MAGLEPGLKARLRRLRVHVDQTDENTFLLRGVPADASRFTKPVTSVLVKRPRLGLPFLLCVDEDLLYAGHDPELARAFAAASCQQGWRVISTGVGVHSQAEDAVQDVLSMLGCAKRPASQRRPKRPPQPPGLLERFGADLSVLYREGALPPSLAHEEQAEQAATALMAWQRRLPVLVGAPGKGKTTLLYKVAGLLNRARPEESLLSVDIARLLAGALWEGEREKLLHTLLEEAVDGRGAIALERIELALMTVSLAPWLLAAALDRGARLIATCLPLFVEKLVQGPLVRRVDVIDVSELVQDDAMTALAGLTKTLTAHHRVEIGNEAIEAAVERSLSLAGPLPDKAITLLDSAAARAALLRQPEVTLCDVYLVASRMREA
jgi:hypothetical protein